MMPVLGTAMWGWSIDQAEAWKLLDAYANAGGVWVDSAVNYPINKDRSSPRAAVLIYEWLRANPGNSLRVWYKVGAQDNSGGSDFSLTHASLLTANRLACSYFGDHIGCLGVHWDNREDADAVSETVAALAGISRENSGKPMPIGLSGVKYPELYAKAAKVLKLTNTPWWVQVKENALTYAARDHYTKMMGSKFFAYGINMGGVKTKIASADRTGSLALRHLTEPERVEAFRQFLGSEAASKMGVRTLNEFALSVISARGGLTGVILGARTVPQLTESLDFIHRLDATPLTAAQKIRLSKLAP
jgi:aryl-alcohol dehydrogenase-like predicted oxidoreductase